ncbi:hypothetical protein UlMin_042196 [Ulmus minor]
MKEKSNDLFQNLPDEILRKIISFLPSETALETSFLSTRWRALWNLCLVQQATLDGIAGAVAEFVTCFDKQDPLRHPRRLQLEFGRGSVLLASLAANNKLKVDFSGEEMEFPSHFGWNLQLNRENSTLQPCPTTFLVKTLHLKSVGFLTNEAVSSILSNFQLLESLKIVECSGLKSLCVESTPKLANLAILDCPNLESVHLKCLKLRSFRYRGKLPRIWPEYHFNLADAMFDFRQGVATDSLNSCDFDPTLLTIKNARVLSLCRWTFEMLIWPSIAPLRENFQFYKLQELWWIAEEGDNMDALISFLKLCPALERLFVTIDPKSYSKPSKTTCLKKVSPKHRDLNSLKVVKLEGFVSKIDEISLKEQIRQLVTLEPLFVTNSDENWSNLLSETPCSNHKHAHMGF